MRNRQPLCILALFGCALLGAPAALRADTVHLKNGYSIHGKVDRDASTDTEWVVRIGDSGFIRLRRDRVESIENNSRDTVASESAVATAVPAAGGEMVTVVLRDSTYFNDRLQTMQPASPRTGIPTPDEDEDFDEARPRARGGISGVRLPSSDDKVYVLRVPGMGTIRLPLELIERTEPYRAPSGDLAPVAAREGVIPTTHVVHLKNGRRLQGNIVPGEASAPLVLELGSLGRVFIDRETIEKTEPIRLEYKLPPPPPAEPEPAPEVGPPIGPPPAGPETAAQPTPAAPEVSPEQRTEILGFLYELTRQRTQNRVRAESGLRRFGAAAIPYLDMVRDHPFDLTRRAVMRLVRDARSMEGLPFAIDAMTDPDSFVRQHAAEALNILSEVDVSYRPDASPAARREAQKALLRHYGLALADSAR